MRHARLLMTACLASVLACACAWGEEGAIRSRLKSLAAEANRPPVEGLALVAHATTVGDYFTTDAVVDLGPGMAPIQGREMLVGMMARLQPRLAAYRVDLADVDVRVDTDGESAGVALTARLSARSGAAAEAPEAREFAITMRKEDGAWRIARMTAVQALR